MGVVDPTTAHVGIVASPIGDAHARASVMVERYAHLAPDHLANAAGRIDSLLGSDLATPEAA